MAKEKVLVAGSLVLDIVAAVDDGADTRMLFAEGKQTELKGVEMYLGGEVGNMGIALSKLGVPVTLVSKVGDDIGGRIIRDFLKSFPVSAAVKTVKNLKSTVSVCLTVPGKDKITFHKRGASQTFTPDDIDETLLRQVDLFHFGYQKTFHLSTDQRSVIFGLSNAQAAATLAAVMAVMVNLLRRLVLTILTPILPQ